MWCSIIKPAQKGQKKKSLSLSREQFFATTWTIVLQAPCPWNSPGKNTGVGSHSLLQGIFLMQGLNLHLLHCRQILYHLSHGESPSRVKPFVNSCSDFSDLCTYTGLHSNYTASFSFHDTELIEGGTLFGHRLGP